jgi:hypothetical protein
MLGEVMNDPSRCIACLRGLAAASGLWLAASTVCAGNPLISFDLTQPQFTATGNGTFTFTGTVTNDSGMTLNASDFFFNFSGFNATAVDPAQDLGVVSEFALANGGTSATVSLFDVTFTKPGAAQMFPILVQLEDINNDLSAAQTVTIAFRGTTAGAPETPTLLLFSSAMIALGLRARWRSRTPQRHSRR